MIERYELQELDLSDSSNGVVVADNSALRKFLIVGTQRTGSSALGEAIGLHPDIFCGWEWTQGVAPWRAIGMASRALAGDFSVLSRHNRSHVVSEFGNEKTVFGFRRLFRSSNKWLGHPRFAGALWVDRLEGHLDWLAKRSDIQIIHIVRGDNVAWLKSKALAAATGQYFGASYPSDVRAVIPISEAIRRLKTKEWVDQRLSTLQHTNRYMKLVYEEFLKDNRGHVCQVVSFLGCDPSRLPVLEMQARPQSSKNSDSQIENIDELRTRLASEGLLTGGRI